MKLVFAVLICIIYYCYGVSLQEQLEHIAARKRESRDGFYIDSKPTVWERFIQNRRPKERRFNDESIILGAPKIPNHLPEAEPILPGHTLIRPALGMLKSALKFPHKDPDNGAGVYGNINNLGIQYAGQRQRVLYSGFRRSFGDYIMDDNNNVPEDLLRLNGKTVMAYKSKKQRKAKNQKKSDKLIKILHAFAPNNDLVKGKKIGQLKPLLENSLGSTAFQKNKSFNDENSKTEITASDNIEVEEDLNKQNSLSQDTLAHVKLHLKGPKNNKVFLGEQPLEDIRKWWCYSRHDHSPLVEAFERANRIC